MNIFNLSVCLFVALVVVKHVLDMCKTRAEIDLIYRMCKFLAVAYVDDHTEHTEFFNDVIKSEEEF